MFSPTEVLSSQPDVIINSLGLLAFTLFGMYGVSRLVQHLSLRRQKKRLAHPLQRK